MFVPFYNNCENSNNELLANTWRVLLAAVLGFAIAIATLPTVGVFVGVCFCFLLWRNINVATYVVLFIVYSNSAAVAVNFHNVPAMVAHAVMGLLLVPIVFHASTRKQLISVGPSFPWILGLAAIQFIGVICSRDPNTSWEYFVTFLQEGLLLYLLVHNAIRCEAGLRGATWAVLCAGILMGAVPLFQQLSGQVESEMGGFGQTGGEPGFEVESAAGESIQQRLAGSIGEKNRYAQVMLMLIPLALFRFRDETKLAWRVLAVLALFLVTVGALLAFSRSTIIAMGFVAVFAAWKGFVKRSHVAVVFALGVIAMLAMPQYRTRLASLVNLKSLLSAGKHSAADGALKGRATEMGAAVLVFVDHPYVGVGPGMFKKYSREYGERIGLRALAPERQAHCLPLDVAAENGFPGLCCLMAIFFVTTSGLLKVAQQQNRKVLAGLSSGYVLMIAMYFATGIFLHFAFIRYFWLMIALADSTIVIAKERALSQSLLNHGSVR